MSLKRKPGVQGLMLAGHPRSGTTILNRFLNSHIQITLTFEFRAFMALDAPYDQYVKKLRKNWRPRRLIIERRRKNKDYPEHIINKMFLDTFLNNLERYDGCVIHFIQVLESYERALPNIPIVGDKYPDYIDGLERFVAIPDLKRIVIYRDCRAVVRSALEMSRTKWVGKPAAKRYGTVEKISHSWVKAIATMEERRDKIHIIRYEDFVTDPEREAARLGVYLGVKPEGFRTKMITSARIKKYISELSVDDLKVIDDIAGPTMKRLGYIK